MTVQKTAFVIGASSGIGYAVAIELAQRGFKVYAGARRLYRLEPLKKHNINVLQIDSTKTEDIRKARDLIASENNNSLDILYYNAGVMVPSAAYDETDAGITRLFEVNVFGAMKTVREFHKLVVNAKGLIAVTSSIAGIMPLPLFSAYAATKAAIISYTDTLAVESKPFGVCVMNIVTGAVETELGEATKYPKDSLFYETDDDEYRVVPDTEMKAQVYAKKVVTDFENALKSSNNYWVTYRGVNATFVWFAITFLPRFLSVSLIIKALKLDQKFARLTKKAKGLKRA